MGYVLSEEMKTEISNRILVKLKNAGILVKNVDFQAIRDRKVGALSQPAANISINSGTFQKVTLTTYKQAVIVSIFIMVQELRGEYARRFMIYELITSLAKVLLLEKLGLPLQDSLKPVGFNDVTDEKYSDAGYLIYQLNMACSFNIHKDEEEDIGELESIVNHYFLQDPTDDGVQDAEGLVELYSALGGNAYSIFRLPVLFGGHAGSKFEDVSIYGGKAGSTY